MRDVSPQVQLTDRLRAELRLTDATPVRSSALPPLPSHLPAAELAAACVAAVAAAATELTSAPFRAGSPDRIAVAYTSERWLRIDDIVPAAFAPLSGFFRTADGWVRTHGNYPHHAAVLRRVLALDAPTREDAAAALMRRTAVQVSDDVTAAGGLCVPVAVEDAAADATLRRRPLISVGRIGPAERAPRLSGAIAPLQGIRVLDLTRVIAGPVGTRTLALLGADVLRIDPPGMPEISWQHIDTGHGKRSARLDLTLAADRDRFARLVSRADVVALGYRPRALERLGLSPAALADRRPGIVVARHSAWGDSDRRGFDSLVQAATGIAWLDSPDGSRPGALPAQALDHSAGYLLAAGVMTALARRAVEGGSWLVETSLRRVAAEILGMPRSELLSPADALDDASAHVQRFEVAGHAVQTAAPAITRSGDPLVFAPPRPWGQDEPVWLET